MGGSLPARWRGWCLAECDNGFPHVIPIGFYWDGNQLVVCTAVTAPKVKALSSRPDVAITIAASLAELIGAVDQAAS